MKEIKCILLSLRSFCIFVGQGKERLKIANRHKKTYETVYDSVSKSGYHAGPLGALSGY
jgi:hypothetical protein